MPLDQRAIAHLSNNSPGLDLYTLFAYRIREVLSDVLARYPEARIEVTRHGLLLKPSQPAVRRTKLNGIRLIDAPKQGRG